MVNMYRVYEIVGSLNPAPLWPVSVRKKGLLCVSCFLRLAKLTTSSYATDHVTYMSQDWVTRRPCLLITGSGLRPLTSIPIQLFLEPEYMRPKSKRTEHGAPLALQAKTTLH